MKNIILFIFTFCLGIQKVWAQIAPPNPGDENPNGNIDMIIILVLISGMAIQYYFFRKKLIKKSAN